MKIKELLTDESRWTKGASARDKDGKAVLLGRDDASCFCLGGAINVCYGLYEGDSDSIARRVAETIRRNHGSKNGPWSIIVDFNDNPKTTFGDIRKIIEEADV